MITTIFLPVLFVLSLGMQQETNKQSAIQLLTQKTWTLVSYGFDDNHNNTIDIPEECIADCNKDDTYGFRADGTGLYSDNMLSCCTGISELSFQWKLNGPGILVDFQGRSAMVLALTGEQLVIAGTGKTNNGTPVRLIQLFRH